MREHLGKSRGARRRVDGGSTAGHSLCVAHGNVLTRALGTPASTGSITILAGAVRTTASAPGTGRCFGRQGGNGFPCRTLFFEMACGV